MNRSSYIKAILLAASLAAAAGCTSSEKEREPVVNVQITPAEKTSLAQIVSTEAVIYPRQQATVAPKISSTIAEFKVQRGSHVRKGQILAILENKDLAAQAEASHGDFDQANANYEITLQSGLPQQLQKSKLDAAAAQSAFDAARKVYDSRKDLFEQGAIPRRDLDSADVALAQARSQNEQAQKQLADLQRIGQEQLTKAAQGTKESAEGHYLAANAELSYSEIRSPIDGVVTDRPLYAGDLAIANQPILTVMDTSTLVAKAHIPQPEAVLLTVGDGASLKVPNVDEPVKGRVILVSPALDPGSTTMEVWVEIQRSGSVVKPGMTATLDIIAKTVKDAVVVPSVAIFKNADGAYYVLLAGSDNKAHQNLVQVGVKNADLTQIAGGIQTGDPVITTGGFAIPDGTAIRVEKPTEKDQNTPNEPGDPKEEKPSPQKPDENTKTDKDKK
jgi:HlyD family secretion protein